MKQIPQTQGIRRVGTAFSAYQSRSRPLTPESKECKSLIKCRWWGDSNNKKIE